jgi:D-sedoheptulose 7-phosphate isomerase
MSWTQHVEESLRQSIDVKEKLIQHHKAVIVDMAQRVVESLEKGGTLFLCGNGGSLADAQHLAAELLIRLRSTHNRQSLPALCLATDMSSVTACGNDYGFDDIFARPLEGLGRAGDVLLGITTSGQSPNVLKAFHVAKNKGMTTLGFLGQEGGPALNVCDAALLVPSTITARIQEAHITVGHILMVLIEDMLLAKGKLKLS